jgi:cation-transporting ATPase F
MWLFHFETSGGASIAEARTSALNLFVTTEAFYLFACRSVTRPTWQVGAFSNRWVIGGVAVQVLAQIAITYVPAMNSVFGTAPIGVGAWARLLLVAAGGSLVVAVDKRIRRVVAAQKGRVPTSSQ